jgi:RimJ/RimL family protein N-acetyltransferase
MWRRSEVLTPIEKAVISTLPWVGSRVRLQSLTVDDAELLVRLESDQQVMHHLGGITENTAEFVTSSIANGRGLTPSMMRIERVTDGAALGYGAVFENDRVGAGESDILIALLPEHQKKDYGPEVLELIRDAWLTALNRSHCTATVSPKNIASIKVLLRCGFTKRGHCRNKAGDTQDIYRYDGHR